MSTEGITRAEFLREANKRIGKSGSDLFARYGVKTHWCMMQVYYLMHDVCGISEFPKTFSCSGFTATSFAKKRLNYDFKTAEIGDIVLFELNGNRADGADHVGVVIDNTGNSIKLLEGNTGGNENGDFCGTSSTNVFEYSYTARCLDCIIDMSEFFTEKIEEKRKAGTKIDESQERFKQAGYTAQQRFKGLGEMDAAQLWETTMNPENRTLVRVNINDAEKADSIFSKLMGDQAELRKNFIQARAASVNLDDLDF